MYSIMHLVLHLLEELPCSGGITIIVNGCSIDVSQFLIEVTFGESDFTYLLQELFEVVNADERSILHPLLVYHIASDSILTKHKGAPLAELCGSP